MGLYILFNASYIVVAVGQILQHIFALYFTLQMEDSSIEL